MGSEAVNRPFVFGAVEYEGLRGYKHVAPDGGITGDGDPYGIFALYLALIWRLTAPFLLYVVPRYWRDEAIAGGAGAPYALIDWEFGVENTEGPELGEIRGFMPARSSVRFSPPPPPWEVEHARQAGLFEIWSYRTLREMIPLGLDASHELNVFAVEGGGPTRMVEELRGREPPLMSNVLGPRDVFVDLNISADLGPRDTLVVLSHLDVGDRLFSVKREYEAAIKAYDSERQRDMSKLLNIGEERRPPP